MPIIIKDKKFSGTFNDSIFQQMVTSIKGLPQPGIIPLHVQEISTASTVLCLQGEIAYVDEFNPAYSIKYIGSKNVFSCILVYLHSETDHALIHVDVIRDIDFVSILLKFNYRNEIKITLAGGDESELSKNNLKNILEKLLLAANKLDINLIIEKQKIIESNRFTSEDKYTFMYDKIFEKANFLFYRWFKKSLKLEDFSMRTANDLKERSIGKNQHLEMFVTLLLQTGGIQRSSKKQQFEPLEKMTKSIVLNEENFKLFVDLALSQEGFSLLDKVYQFNNLYSDSKLNNFVFDVVTGKIYIISSHTPTPHEEFRSAAIMDFFKKCKYFLCYDGRLGEYVKPELSSIFMTKCQIFKPIFDQDTFLDETQIKFITTSLNVPNNISILNNLAKFIRSSVGVQSKKVSDSSQGNFFKLPKKFLDFYQEKEIVNSNLHNLCQIIDGEYKFNAKMRYYPTFTVDATLTCSSEKEALGIKKQIEEKNIPVKLITFADNQYCICVPAINVEHYAKAIKSAIN